MKVHRLKLKANSIRCLANSRSSEKRKILHLENLLKEHVTGPRLQFIMSQIRASTAKTVRGLRWKCADKALALSLYHSSPKAYRLLRRTLVLPSVRTLKRVMRNIDVQPGFNINILSALQLKLEKLPAASKLVSIAMDEMAIKQGLAYDGKRDRVEGFAEGEALADHALAFVVRGIVHRWKQPFAFFFSCGPISAATMKTLLFDAIERLQKIGLTVVVVLSDQGSNNISLFQTMLRTSVDSPFFMYGEQKVYVMYDPPHLLKNVRNNLHKHGFLVDGRPVEWKFVREFHAADSSKPTRMAPKLTRRHLDLPPFSTLRVKLAAQVLSHSVATGMNVMAQWGLISEDAGHTADFLEAFDQLFNAFNSSSPKSSARMKGAFTATSGHIEFLTDKLAWLQRLKSRGPRTLPCIKGWQMDITCLLQMWETLHNEHGVRELRTRQLNQDCVENLFSIIRSKGGARDNPDAQQFRAAMSQVMVDAVMQPGKMANCEEDVDEFLLSLNNSTTPTLGLLPLTPSPEIVLPELPSTMQPLVNSTPPELSLQEQNVVTYIGGYVVKKIRDKVCEPCQQKICSGTSSTITSYSQSQGFLATKAYGEALAGLHVPSLLLTDVLESMELKFLEVINSAMYCPGVKSVLLASLQNAVGFNNLSCDSCPVQALVVGLMVNIRLHHSIRQSNIALRNRTNRKNRKVLKFSHL